MKRGGMIMCFCLLVNLVNPIVCDAAHMPGLRGEPGLPGSRREPGLQGEAMLPGLQEKPGLQGEQEIQRELDSQELSAESTVQVQAPSAVLMEASTGQIIYEKNADERRSPASITKIMTLILIFDAIDEGKIRLTDEVVTSAHAKSMGGSQVFLEEGEVQTVETLIKCIVVASGNDASVAMAEYIAGSEDAFVQRMNERAKALGMSGTHFTDF